MYLTKQDSISILETCNSLHEIYPHDSKFKSIPIPNTQKPGFSSIYRNKSSPDQLVEKIHPKLETFHDFFQHALNLFGDEYCYGSRPIIKDDYKVQEWFEYLTYRQIETRKDNFASGLIQLVQSQPRFPSDEFLDGFLRKPNFVVSIYSENRIEWMITDLATRDYSLPNTALYDTLGPQSSKYILDLTKSPVLVLSRVNIIKILKLKQNFGLNYLHLLISMDKLNLDEDADADHDDSGLIKFSNSLGIKLYDFQYVENFGSHNKLPKDFNLPNPSTIYTISFTSGTTGNPKGVLINHKIAVSGISSCFIHFPKPINHKIKHDDIASGVDVSAATSNYNYDFSNNLDNEGRQLRALSYLPLAHIYERMLINWATFTGIAIAFPTSSITTATTTATGGNFSLFDDLKILQPHYFTGVPRIYSRIESFIKSYIESLDPISQKSFMKSMEQSEDTRLTSSNEEIISELKSKLGFQNVYYCKSASAPISPISIIFLQKTLQIGFENSYGLTESFAVISSNDPFGDSYMGNVGPPCVSTEMRLKDVEHMGYSATTNDSPPRGELQLRGVQMFSGYYLNEDATKEAISDDDGRWFNTGDIATFDNEGRIIIIDRVKNFFKLSQGEYITPEKIENTYLTSNHLQITQLFVFGDSLQNYIVGIAGIEPIFFKKFLKQDFNIEVIDYNHMRIHLDDPKIKRNFLEILNNNAMRQGTLQGFEKIHNLYLDFEPLKVEDEVLTPTFKLKRVQAVKKFQNILEKLYQEGSLIRDTTLTKL